MSYNTSLTLSKDSWSKSNKYSIFHIRLQWDIFCYRLGSISDRNGFIAYFVITGLAIQEKIRIFDETFVTCCIESQDFNKFRCSLWRLFCQQDDLACQWISVNLRFSQTKGYLFSLFSSIHFPLLRTAQPTATRLPPHFRKMKVKHEIWQRCYIIFDLNSKLFDAHHSSHPTGLWMTYICMYIYINIYKDIKGSRWDMLNFRVNCKLKTSQLNNRSVDAYWITHFTTLTFDRFFYQRSVCY